MSVVIETLRGDALTSAVPSLAELRMTVFRDFPYLYDGSLEYERKYLAGFSRAKGATIVVARDAGRIVGAATGIPMAEADPAFAGAFRADQRDIRNLFYCAESVLLFDYRGQDIGHAFFDERERHARSLGFAESCFCAVIRAPNHPLKPDGYRPLDPFWRKRGYAPLPGVQATFAWQDVGDVEESEKKLQFWHRDLI